MPYFCATAGLQGFLWTFLLAKPAARGPGLTLAPRQLTGKVNSVRPRVSCGSHRGATPPSHLTAPTPATDPGPAKPPCQARTSGGPAPLSPVRRPCSSTRRSKSQQCWPALSHNRHTVPQRGAGAGRGGGTLEPSSLAGIERGGHRLPNGAGKGGAEGGAAGSALPAGPPPLLRSPHCPSGQPEGWCLSRLCPFRAFRVGMGRAELAGSPARGGGCWRIAQAISGWLGPAVVG